MRYTSLTRKFFEAGPCRTPQLQEELNQLSFQTLYSVCKILKATVTFWYFSMDIIKMLDKQVSRDYLNCDETLTSWRQNLQEQFAHLISDLQAVFLRTEDTWDDNLLSLIYEVQNFHILQVEASEPASVFPLWPYKEYRESFHWVVMILFTKHPQYQRLEFTEEHYTKVADNIIGLTDIP